MENLDELRETAQRMYRYWQDDKVTFDEYYAAQEAYEKAAQQTA